MKSIARVLLLLAACAALVVGVSRHGYRVDKAQLTEGMALTFHFKPALAEHFSTHGSYARLNEKSLQGAREGQYVQAITFENARDASITVTARFRESGYFGQFSGKSISIATLDGGKSWKCILPKIHVGFFTPTSDLLATLKPCY